MPKQVKGNAGRKPPEPAADHAVIDDWFRRQMPHLQPIVEQLDESIRSTIPGICILEASSPGTLSSSRSVPSWLPVKS
jgi:hypothetical protein